MEKIKTLTATNARLVSNGVHQKNKADKKTQKVTMNKSWIQHNTYGCRDIKILGEKTA